MNVRQFIQKLKKLPQDKDIFIEAVSNTFDDFDQYFLIDTIEKDQKGDIVLKIRLD